TIASTKSPGISSVRVNVMTVRPKRIGTVMMRRRRMYCVTGTLVAAVSHSSLHRPVHGAIVARVPGMVHHPDGIVAESRDALIDRDQPLELEEWIDRKGIVDDPLDLVVGVFLGARARRSLALLEELLDLRIAGVPLVSSLAG